MVQGPTIVQQSKSL